MKMRKNEIKSPNIFPTLELQENIIFDIIEEPDLSALKGVIRKKKENDFWNYNKIFIKNKYTRLKERYLNGILPVITR